MIEAFGGQSALNIYFSRALCRCVNLLFPLSSYIYMQYFFALQPSRAFIVSQKSLWMSGNAVMVIELIHMQTQAIHTLQNQNILVFK